MRQIQIISKLNILRKLSKKSPPKTKKSNEDKLYQHRKRQEGYLQEQLKIKGTADAINKWIFSYNKINLSLKLTSHIKNLDKLIEKCPVTTEAFIVYRGIRLNKTDEFRSENPSFTATSADRMRAEGFLYGNQGLLLEIEIPKGRKILALQFDNSEEEFLLPRNSQILIKKICGETAEAILI